MTEAIIYDITIDAGADYQIDFFYEDDDGTVISAEGWTCEAQLREYPESDEYQTFSCSADEDGFHLTIGHSISQNIGYTKGCYDVFIIDPDGERTKLSKGRAFILPRTTR